MNTLIKILTAIALIAVIVAAVVHVIIVINRPPTTVVQPPPPPPPPIVDVGGDVKPEKTIHVKPDDPILPEYRSINRPEILQNMREEGKTYCSAIVGKVSGRAKKRDWEAIQVAANFNYIYTMKTTGKIIKNDGRTIVEERRFDNVGENCVVTDVSARLSLPEEGMVGKFIDSFVRGITGGLVSGRDAVKLANHVIRFDKVPEGMMPFLEEIFDTDEIADKIKMLSKEKDGRILEGKTVRITFEDGMGVTKIEPVGNYKLSVEEQEIIKRTNYVMDYYLMPEKKVAVGEEWKINADVFSGLIDPRLPGKIIGEITVERIADFRRKGKGVNKRIRLTDGKISVVNPEGGNTVRGEVTRVSGMAIRPDEHRVVTSAGLRGYVQYKEVSRHHLLFDATMETEPRFEVKYECEVKDN